MPLLKQKAKILNIRKDTEDISTFTLEIEKEIDFKPGQAITLIVGDKRAAYSICSSPSNKKIIQITAKYHSDGHFSPFFFKKQVGEFVDFIGPYGNFILKENEADEYYFIAGGVGITPFRSMILFATEKNLTSKLNLFYSAKDPKEFLYEKEFRQLEEKGKLHNYFTVTREKEHNFETGRFDKEKLKKIITNKNALFYICGSREFVTAIEVSLVEIGIEKHRIRKEKWDA